MTTSTDTPEAIPGSTSTDSPPLLALRGLTKKFGSVTALRDVDLDIPPAHVTALVGDNGAGKSVLIKTLSGLWEPEEGQIIWDDKPVRLRNPKAAEALGITTIYQDLALCDNLDVVANVFLGHEPLRHAMLDEARMEKEARKTMQDLSVTSIGSIRQPVRSLSGGQRQSVAVARAVMGHARLVIMDEPTAALGVSQTAIVLKLIRTLADSGVAVIMISHNLNDVFSVADRLAILYLGRMVATGPAADFDRASVVEYMATGGHSERAIASS